MVEPLFKGKVSQHTVNYIYAIFMVKKMAADKDVEYTNEQVERFIMDKYKFHDHIAREIVTVATKLADKDSVVKHIHDQVGIQNEYLMEIAAEAIK